MLTGYRTIIFNVLMMVLMLIKGFFPDFVIPKEDLLIQGIDGALILGGLIWGAGGIWLRFKTKEPVPPLKKDEPPKPEGWDANGSPLPVLVLVPLIGLLLALAGCTGLRNAYRAADTPVKQAYVVAEHYAATLQEAVDLKAKGLPPGALEAIRQADLVAGPLILGMLAVAKDAEGGKVPQEAVVQAVAKASEALTNLINAVKRAK